VLVGATVIAAVVAPPGDQEYVVAPEAVSVVFCPEQMVVLVGLTAIGTCVTVTVAMALALQPAEVPTTV